jgi:N utilization substance protein A
VLIRSCVREAGDRAKVAVQSIDPDVDPVGACVGLKGSRVQAIIRELKNEKIDIVRYDDDASHFIANALNPAKAIRVLITDLENRRVEVVVDDEQLSIAIGKRGQNVRLAAKLTGWNIDVRSEQEKRREAEAAMGLDLPDLPPADEAAAPAAPVSTLLDELPVDGLDEGLAAALAAAGYPDAKALYHASAGELMDVPGITEELAIRILDAVHTKFGE